MFCNSFASKLQIRTVELLAPCPELRLTRIEEARMQIGRWQSKAVAEHCMDGMDARNGYEADRRLLQGNPEKMFPFDRPRLLERMARGVPSMTRVTDNTKGLLEQAFQLVPSGRNVLQEPIWRLLDPTPLTRPEFSQLELATVGRGMNRDLCKSVDVHLFGVRDECMPDLRVLLSRQRSRICLASQLLEMRRAELDGDLMRYLVQLLDICDQLAVAGHTSDLAVLHPECLSFVRCCFGTVHVAFSSASPHTEAFWLRRIAEAPNALRRAKERSGYC
jgi:hypothetical protein